MNCRLDRPLGRSLFRSLTRGVRCRRPDYLAMALSALNASVRISQRMAKEAPHLFDSTFYKHTRPATEAERAEDAKAWNRHVQKWGKKWGARPG